MNKSNEGLRTPDEWCTMFAVYIIDPDGWRGTLYGYPAKEWDVPISKSEFEARMYHSTIQANGAPLWRS